MYTINAIGKNIIETNLFVSATNAIEDTIVMAMSSNIACVYQTIKI